MTRVPHAPGSLVSCVASFRLGNCIVVNSEKKTWFWYLAGRIGDETPVDSGEIGIVVSNPDLRRENVRPEDSRRVLYVVFPTNIGWITSTWVLEVSPCQ